MLPKIFTIAAKTIANSDMASMEFEKGQSQFMLLKGTEGDILIYNGRSSILVCLMKKGETIGFVISEIRKAVEKLDAIIS